MDFMIVSCSFPELVAELASATLPWRLLREA